MDLCASQIFWESRVSTDVEETLKDYGTANSSTGIVSLTFTDLNQCWSDASANRVACSLPSLGLDYQRGSTFLMTWLELL